jgi:hypothetical protein
MTERLNQLMVAEADRLDIPPVAADAALARGRGMRRRRTFATAGATVAVLAVIGGTALVATGGNNDDDRATEPAAPAAAADVPAFGFQSKVYVGDKTATVPDTVHSLHYTSEGVLVRSNPNDGGSDGSGPESLTLVRYDGSTVDLGTIPEGVGPATDPAEPVYVLAEARDGGFVAVVRDATTGETVNEVPLPDLPMSYWAVPPLAFDGDTVYAGYKDETAAVDLETGEHHVVEGVSGGIPDVLGGRILAAQGTSLSVLEADTGELVRTFEVGHDAFGTLSPDGGHLAVSTFDDETFGYNLSVYDLATGEPADLRELSGAQYLGWTAAGGAFTVEKGVLTSCDLGSGDCTQRDVDLPKEAFVKLGGRTYES